MINLSFLNINASAKLRVWVNVNPIWKPLNAMHEPSRSDEMLASRKPVKGYDCFQQLGQTLLRCSCGLVNWAPAQAWRLSGKRMSLNALRMAGGT